MRTIALACCALLAPAAAAQELRDALAAKDLICEVRHGYERELFASIAPYQPRADLMLVYESVNGTAPRVVSTQRPGRHAIDVRVTAHAVHFLEPVGPSMRQTTLTACLQTKWKNGYDTCVRFAARYAWHFDNGAYGDPDAALARLQSSASNGVCEAWTVD